MLLVPTHRTARLAEHLEEVVVEALRLSPLIGSVLPLPSFGHEDALKEEPVVLAHSLGDLTSTTGQNPQGNLQLPD